MKKKSQHLPGRSGKTVKTSSLQRVTLQRVTLQRVTLQRVTLQRVTLQWVTLQRLTLQRVTLQRVTLQWVTLQRLTLQRVTLQWVTLQRVTLQWVTLQLRLEHEASAVRGRNANHLTLTYVNENVNGRNEDKTNLIINILSLEALKLKNVCYFAT
jgi:hypothetical protein